MSVPARYDAFWVPGLDHDIDRDEGVPAALNWLASAERKYGGAGVIVMYAKSMIGNAPLLAKAAQRWEVVSPRSRRPSRKGPVLAVWPPNPGVLEFAETLALDAALCVVSGRYDIRPWVSKASAACLLDGYQPDHAEQNLHPGVASLLDAMLSVDGHNGFIGAGGKGDAIRRLRTIARRTDRPTSQSVEDYLVSTGETSAKGAGRARRWYDEIIAGKQHRDDTGRVIR